MKPSFSQRFGHEQINTLLQHDSISMDLKNAIWNVMYEQYFKHHFIHLGISNAYEKFLKVYWTKYLKNPIDQTPRDLRDANQRVRGSFYHPEWYISYNFVEFVADYAASEGHNMYEEINEALELERSSYRFVSGQLTDITSAEEIAALEDAITDTSFTGVSAHLTTALKLYSDRVAPDYRNSIKESISAVESMAKIVTKNPKATLSDALKALEKQGQLHKALKDGFEKLYAYTSDANGIRHAMLDEPDLTAADAKYFLLSCSSFVNYLKSKI